MILLRFQSASIDCGCFCPSGWYLTSGVRDFRVLLYVLGSVCWQMSRNVRCQLRGVQRETHVTTANEDD